MKLIYKLLLIAILISNISFGQNNKDIALQKAQEAIKLMDDGKIDESIVILKESQKLDSENFDYPYEIAYANYLKKDYKTAIKILETLEGYKNKNYQLYTLWGNSYDNLGEVKKAIEIYDSGIKIYPKKGNLYLEKGVVYEFEKDYNKAVECYQKGISVDPKYPSNYYRIANLYLKSSDKVPGLIYGEIFVNLERTTKRTQEMSESLYNAYKNSVVFENNQWKELNLCKETRIDIFNFEKDKHLKLPLCMSFGKDFILGLINTNPKEINLETLSKIRQEFLKSYFEKNFKDYYPNMLFDYQKQMDDKGIFDSYNHYIFQIGAENEFSDWLKTHEVDYKKFMDWYTTNENLINPTEKNYFEFTN